MWRTKREERAEFIACLHGGHEKNMKTITHISDKTTARVYIWKKIKMKNSTSRYFTLKYTGWAKTFSTKKETEK